MHVRLRVEREHRVGLISQHIRQISVRYDAGVFQKVREKNQKKGNSGQ